LLYPEEVPEYLIAPHPSYPISSSPPTNWPYFLTIRQSSTHTA
jgi:hypothetical protein